MIFSGFRTERRKYQRLRVNMSALCRISGPRSLLYLLQGYEFEAKTYDLSEAGVSILTGYDIPPETHLFMKFIIYEFGLSTETAFHDVLQVFGDITYCHCLEDGFYRLGVKFTGLQEDQLNTIHDLMYSAISNPNYSYSQE